MGSFIRPVERAVSRIFKPESPPPPPPLPSIELPPLEPAPAPEVETEIDPVTGDVTKPGVTAAWAALIATSPRGVLNQANTGRRRLTG